jgi:hypothetical protein
MSAINSGTGWLKKVDLEVDEDAFQGDELDCTEWLNYSKQTVRSSSDFISKPYSFV